MRAAVPTNEGEGAWLRSNDGGAGGGGEAALPCLLERSPSAFEDRLESKYVDH